MPTPLIHISIGVAGAICSAGRVATWPSLIPFIAAANLADLDFIPGFLLGDPTRFHHGVSHSLTMALLIALTCWAFSRRHFLALALVAMTHPLLDLGTVDRYDFYRGHHHGIPLFWPFSSHELFPLFNWFTAPQVALPWSKILSRVNLGIFLHELLAALVILTVPLIVRLLGRKVSAEPTRC